MRRILASRLAVGIQMIAVFLTTAGNADAQALAGSGPPVPILEAMTGRWQVKQTMWTGPNALPVEQPPAIALRRLAAGGGFIEEEMTLATTSDSPFTRTSHLNFNAIDGVFEYFSVDTRAPQQMHYQSQPAAPDFKGVLQFRGGTFVAGQWGDRKNAAFAYRVELSPVKDGQQTMQLFLRPLATGAQPEFLAFRYEYRRR